MKKQVSINFDLELLEKIDQYAKNLNINRSGAIAVLTNIALQQDSIMDILPELLKTSKKK